MTTRTTTAARTSGDGLTRSNRWGLALAGVLGLLDVVGAVAVPTPEAGGDGPPLGITILSGVLAVLTLLAVVWAWRTGSRTAVRLTAGMRILAVITSLPALFVDVDPAVKASVAVFVLLSAAAVILMLSPERRSTRVTD